MAKIHGDQDEGFDGEKLALKLLRDELPSDWDVFYRRFFPLRRPDKERPKVKEVDFLVVGPRKIFVLDEKSYRGPISGSTESWDREGVRDKSPIEKVTRVAMDVVRAFIQHRVPSLRARPKVFIDGIVVLSQPSANVDRVDDPRTASSVWRLSETPTRLRRRDADVRSEESIEDFRREIISCLSVDEVLPTHPRQVGPFEVTAEQTTHPSLPDVRIFRAKHVRSGGNWLLKVFPHPSDGAGAARSTRELAYHRECDALQRLRSLDRTGRADQPFDYAAKALRVLPVEVPPGRTLRDLSSKGVQAAESDDVVIVFQDAFAALADIHRSGVVHRLLSPSSIYVQDKPARRVRFGDFVISYVDEEATIHGVLQSPTAIARWSPPEASRGLMAVGRPGDVFSMAASLVPYVLRDTGQIPPDGAGKEDWERALRKRQPALTPALVVVLADVFARTLDPDEGRRPAAEDVAGGLAEAAHAAGLPDVIPDVGREIRNLRFTKRLSGPASRKGPASETWLGQDVLGAEVVIKLYTEEDALGKDRIDALRAASRTSSPCMPPLREAWRQQGKTIAVFEFLTGETAKEFRTRPIEERVDVVRRAGPPVFHALARLHALGLMHRDVSPANLIVGDGAERRLTLIDLDLLTRRQGQRGRSGTPPHIAPELDHGAAFDPSCDVYALGSVLFEFLTGLPPQRADGSIAAEPAGVLHEMLEVLRSAANLERDLRPTSVAIAAQLARAGDAEGRTAAENEALRRKLLLAEEAAERLRAEREAAEAARRELERAARAPRNLESWRDEYPDGNWDRVGPFFEKLLTGAEGGQGPFEGLSAIQARSSDSQGRLGRVYIAMGPNGTCAVKVALPAVISELAPERAREMWGHEMDRLALLQQLGIDGVLRPRTVERRCPGFVISDWVEGETLVEFRARKADRRVSLVASIFARLADTVARLRAHGISVSDLHPMNVIVSTPEDKPVLIDLGLQRPPPPYAPPEWSARSAEFDPTACGNVYSLAVMLVETLCGSGSEIGYAFAVPGGVSSEAEAQGASPVDPGVLRSALVKRLRDRLERDPVLGSDAKALSVSVADKVLLPALNPDSRKRLRDLHRFAELVRIHFRVDR